MLGVLERARQIFRLLGAIKKVDEQISAKVIDFLALISKALRTRFRIAGVLNAKDVEIIERRVCLDSRRGTTSHLPVGLIEPRLSGGPL